MDNVISLLDRFLKCDTCKSFLPTKTYDTGIIRKSAICLKCQMVYSIVVAPSPVIEITISLPKETVDKLHVKALRLLQLVNSIREETSSANLIFPESAKFAGILFTHKNEGFFLGQPKDTESDPRESYYGTLANLCLGKPLAKTNTSESTLPTGDIGSYGLIWTYPGGGIENGETPYDAALRECMEEIGFIPQHKVVNEYLHGNGYITYLAEVPAKFTDESIKLNNESFYYGWYGYGDLPDPLHDGVQPALDAFGINGMNT